MSDEPLRSINGLVKYIATVGNLTEPSRTYLHGQFVKIFQYCHKLHLDCISSDNVYYHVNGSMWNYAVYETAL